MNEPKPLIIPSLMLRFGAMLPAFLEGLRRAASAPAVVVGTFALTLGTARLLGLPLAPSASGWHVLLLNFSNPMDFAPALATIAAPGLIVAAEALQWAVPAGAWLVLWAFLAGGVLDRFARNRPTRGRGFFGACGAHFAAIARLEIIALALYTILIQWRHPRVPLAIAAAAVLFVNLVVDYARVRIVVEDRRSAVGALLAATRFVRRNAAAAGALYLLNALLIVAAGALCAAMVVTPASPGWLLRAGPAACLLLRHFLKLALHASEISLFQARLAHASYTAGPPIEWPESPAAEAIANLTPSALP